LLGRKATVSRYRKPLSQQLGTWGCRKPMAVQRHLAAATTARQAQHAQTRFGLRTHRGGTPRVWPCVPRVPRGVWPTRQPLWRHNGLQPLHTRQRYNRPLRPPQRQRRGTGNRGLRATACSPLGLGGLQHAVRLQAAGVGARATGTVLPVVRYGCRALVACGYSALLVAPVAALAPTGATGGQQWPPIFLPCANSTRMDRVTRRTDPDA